MKQNELISKFRLPAYISGKSFSDASKIISSKFDGRNDMISKTTKNELLKRLADAQEYLKASQESEQQSNQFMLGGSTMFQDKKDNMEGYAFGGTMNKYYSGGYPVTEDTPLDVKDERLLSINDYAKPIIDPNTASSVGTKPGVGASVVNMLPAAIELGTTAFGKPAQNTSGLAPSAKVNTGKMVGNAALKGASLGASVGNVIPVIGTGIGAAVGAGVGAIAGWIGSGKAKRAALKNTNMYTNNIINQHKDQNMNAYGGELSDGLLIDPPSKKTTSKDLTQLSVGNSLTPLAKKNMFIQANQNKPKTKAYNDALDKYMSEENAVNSTVKPIVKIQSGVKNDKMGPGYYVYSKYPVQNIESDREFVSNSGYNVLKGTTPYRNYMKSYDSNTKTYNNTFKWGGNPYTVSNNLKPITTPNDGMSPIWERNTLGQGDSNEDLGNLKNDLEYAQYMNQLPTGSVETGTSDKKGSNGLNKAGAYLKDNYANILRYAPAAMNAFQLAKLKKPGYVTTKKLTNEYTPQQVDEVRLRNEIDTQYNNSIGSLSGATGGSNAATTAAILAATANRGRDVSDMMNKSQDYNRAEKEKAYTYKAATDSANIGQYNLEQDINDKNMGNYDTQKSKYLTGIGDNLRDVGTEQLRKQMPGKMGLHFDHEGKPIDGTYQNPQTKEWFSKEGVMIIDKNGKEVVNKSAKGGYLNQNVLDHINTMYTSRNKK